MESDRRLNRWGWGLTFTPTVINRFAQIGDLRTTLVASLEHQGRANHDTSYAVWNQLGGATDDVGYYVSFAGENGEPPPVVADARSAQTVVTGRTPSSSRLRADAGSRCSNRADIRASCASHATGFLLQLRPGNGPKLEAEEVFRGEHGYLALELWGKDKDLRGCVRPQFFTRSGEEIELPFRFDEAVKATTSRCELCGLSASALLPSRLVGAATTTTDARRRTRIPKLMSADIVSLAQGV